MTLLREFWRQYRTLWTDAFTAPDVFVRFGARITILVFHAPLVSFLAILAMLAGRP